MAVSTNHGVVVVSLFFKIHLILSVSILKIQVN